MGTDTNNPLNMLILPPHTATPRGRSIPSDLSYRQWLQHKKNTNRFYKIHNSCSIIPIPILFKIFLQETSPLFIYFSTQTSALDGYSVFPNTLSLSYYSKYFQLLSELYSKCVEAFCQNQITPVINNSTTQQQLMSIFPQFHPTDIQS